MDTFTLTIILSLANGIQVAAFYGQYRVDRSHSGLNWWTAASALLAFGFVCNSLRSIPAIAPTAIIANNILFFAGFSLFYVGVLRFFGKRERRELLGGAGIGFTLLIIYFTYGNNDLTSRRILVSSAVTILSLLISRALVVHKVASVTTSAHFLATVFLVNSCFFALRAASLLVNAPDSAAFASSLAETATYTAVLALSTLWTFGFIIMLNHRLNAEHLESKEHFEQIFNTSPDAVLITRLSDAVLVGINDGFSSLTGYSVAEVIGKTSLSLNIWRSEEDRHRFIAELQEKGFCENLEMVFQRKDGSQLFGMISAKIITMRGAPHILSVTRNITKKKELEAALQERENHYRQLTEEISDVVWRLDPEYRFTYISPADERLRGYTAEEVLGHHVFELMTDDGIASIQEKTGQRIAAEQRNGTLINHLSFEVQQRCKDGSFIWTEILSTAERDANGSITGFHGITRNINERKLAETMLEETNRKLEALSTTDGLTGIANRRHFDDVLAKEHARHARSGTELSLILLDIDYFKLFNDNYGHIKGDDCLRQIARTLADCAIRPADLAARYGGEEFACILPETDRSGAIIIAEKIRRGISALAIPHKGSNVSKHVTASLGIVTTRCHADQPVTDILSQVDTLLYQAKSSGRNRVESGTGTPIGVLAGDPLKENLIHLSWKDSFCSGNRVIDTQHQGLFQIANELFEAVLSGHRETEISAIIDRLLADTGKHFYDEQQILAETEFPGIAQHAEEHAALLATGTELSGQFAEGTLTIGTIFQFFVHDVVMVHMLGADREYFSYLYDHLPAASHLETFH